MTISAAQVNRTVRAIIRGRVQGVSFRYWARSEADRLRLRGWICNRADGSVEAVFSGEAAEVDAMLEACLTGPPAARVRHIETEPVDPAGLADAFEVRLA